MQPSSPQHQCSICQCETGCVHTAEERMFGWGDVFHYRECDHCGCLQLLDPPGDLGRFYPEESYYSFQNNLPVSLPRNPLRRWLMRRRNEAQLVRRGGIGRLLRTLRESPGIEQIRPWFEPLSEVTLSSRILDVGCGKGETLSMLAGLGFDDLTGIDPYLQAESDEPPIRLRACALEELDRDQFDFIMFHHSFEHLPDPRATLNVARRKLSPAGACLIRIPLASRGPGNDIPPAGSNSMHPAIFSCTPNTV